MKRGRILSAQTRESLHTNLVIALLLVMVFQSPLAEAVDVLRYIDEVIALVAVVLMGVILIKTGRLRVKQYILLQAIPLAAFVLIGLLGNVIFQYQNWKAIAVDVFTSVKFFLAVALGYLVLPEVMTGAYTGRVAKNLRFVSIFLFVLFVAERFFPIFGPLPERYGIYAAKLFYFHPTYLVSALGVLLAGMLMFYEKRNIPFMVLDLVVMVFSLRGKAFAVAAVFAAIFLFVMLLKRELKVWHLLIGAVAVVAICWERFIYYFVTTADYSPRNLMTKASLDIIVTHFPIGGGFATFGSNAAYESYSPLYYRYGFDNILGMMPVNPTEGPWLNDVFWPMILGQTGILGTLAFAVVLALLFIKVWKLGKLNLGWYASGLFIVAFLLLSTTADSAFSNAMCLPYGVLLGGLVKQAEALRSPEKSKELDVTLWRKKQS